MRIFIVAGEHSGDFLGGKLLEALREQYEGTLELAGVGGEHMEQQGVASLFPLEDVAVMGPVEIAKNLPRIVRRVYQTVAAAKAFTPDLVIIIDSPEFTHPIAKRIRKERPDVPIVDYVSPSVWAWRPGRARKMKAYITHVLGLLPFEPEAYRKLDGPPCTYVGHSLIEKKDWIEKLDLEAFRDRNHLDREQDIFLVLPGSRRNEISRLMPVYGEVLLALHQQYPDVQFVLPVVEARRKMVESLMQDWPVKAVIVRGEEDKFAAFRSARAALAASGTVTLELALAGCPMVVVYKMDSLAYMLRFLVNVRSIVLANLVLDENVFPEFIQEAATAENLVAAASDLLAGGAVYRRQIEALETIEHRLTLTHTTPSEAAARGGLEVVGKEKPQDF